MSYPETLCVNGTEYRILRLLGKGKGGYSYLAARDSQQYVLKQIHHEPCAYYQFGDKMQAELNDYARLRAAGVPIPEMLDADCGSERILKQYIPAIPSTASSCVTGCPAGASRKWKRSASACTPPG